MTTSVPTHAFDAPGRSNSEVSTLRRLQAEASARLRSGESLDQIEGELIETSPLPDDAKAALWLYAWAYLERGRARYEHHVRRQAGFLQPVLGTE